ncbi:MAG: formylglycine-generating enzyme family protein [Verrucomicrobia bacterium]|nr:formylglycine-generating enzyme family protein [Verrucomicrobiota bacterium]
MNLSAAFRNLILAACCAGVALAQTPPAVAPVVTPAPVFGRGAAAGQPSFVNAVGIRIVLIPASEFDMGSPKNESWRYSEENLHHVTITKPFYLGATEVTQAQFAAVMRKSPSYYKGADLPVEHVTWFDALEFCRRLNFMDGRAYRLPTEAEWEYACRAGTDDKFYSGDNDADLFKAAWVGGVSSSHTHPVAKLAPNNFGLFDMLGNVYEWCADYYDANYYFKSPKTNPPGPSKGVERVIRGGAYNEPVQNVRCAYRTGKDPMKTQANLGFRIACDVPPPRASAPPITKP